jgi:hypothetical protein
MWKKIKHWYWWYFKATEEERSLWDMMTTGHGIMKGGKRINPRNLFSN